MVTEAERGAADADAYLAGEVMPSARAEQTRRVDVLLDAGGELR